VWPVVEKEDLVDELARCLSALRPDV
jgi:hypothetical protein